MNDYLNLKSVLRSVFLISGSKKRKTRVLGLNKNNYFLLNCNVTRNWFIVRPRFFQIFLTIFLQKVSFHMKVFTITCKPTIYMFLCDITKDKGA